MTPTVAQLLEYVSSDLFKIRCSEIRQRQDAGEDFDLPQLAEALGIPLVLADIWLASMTEKVLARIVVPDNGGVSN
jgi:hypothetical protein